MKNFVNKHTTLLIVLAIMPLNSILYLTSKYIFDYWNITMFSIQNGLFLIQLISFILVFFVSEEHKIRFKNPFKKLFTLLLICTLLSSCNVYLNCNINKTQQLSKRQIDKHHKQAEKQTELQESIWY